MAKKLSMQETFNKVYTHFVLKGGLPSINEHNTCQYRMEGKKVRKCAIGVCIPKSLYLPRMENRDAQQLLSDFPSVSELFDESVGIYFLKTLQKNHDSAAMNYPFKFPEEIKRSLELMAQKYSLTIPQE